jgi:hypothetical protein
MRIEPEKILEKRGVAAIGLHEERLTQIAGPRGAAGAEQCWVFRLVMGCREKGKFRDKHWMP